MRVDLMGVDRGEVASFVSLDTAIFFEPYMGSFFLGCVGSRERGRDGKGWIG